MAGCETLRNKNQRNTDSAVMRDEQYKTVLTMGRGVGRVRTLVSRGSEGCWNGVCGVDGGISLAHVFESSSSDPHILVLCVDGQGRSRAARGRRHCSQSRISRLGLVGRRENLCIRSTSIAMPMQSSSGRGGVLLTVG